MEKKSGTRIFTAAAYTYLLLPFIIFAVGWMRFYFALPTALITIYCGAAAWRDTPYMWRPEISKDNVIKIIFICSVIAVWVYYSGIGFRVFQNSDHTFRNGIFETLVNNRWPVYNRDITADIYPAGTSVTALIYYIGFWMPAALFGKLFGLKAGYTFQMIWAFIGIALTYYYICARKKRLLVWPLLLLVFFSGPDIIGKFSVGENLFSMANDVHLEWWVWPYQYSSNTTQLYWVFNQAVPAWLCTAFILMHTNNRSLIFIISAILLNSTFPFLGILPFVIYMALSRKYDGIEGSGRKEHFISYLKAFAKDTITLQNVLGGGIIGIFSYLYLKGNLSASGISSQSFTDILKSVEWAKYFVFILLEAGIYLIALYKYNNKKGIYFVTVLSLVLIPIFKGNSYDFCMRVSIPALFVLMLLIQDTLEQAKVCKDKLTLYFLTFMLCLGSITPIHELERSVQKTIECRNNNTAFGTTESESNILNHRNFSGSAEDSLFFTLFAKKPLNK